MTMDHTAHEIAKKAVLENTKTAFLAACRMVQTQGAQLSFKEDGIQQGQKICSIHIQRLDQNSNFNFGFNTATNLVTTFCQAADLSAADFNMDGVAYEVMRQVAEELKLPEPQTK